MLQNGKREMDNNTPRNDRLKTVTFGKYVTYFPNYKSLRSISCTSEKKMHNAEEKKPQHI